MYNNNYDHYCALYIFTISARASSARRVNGQRRRAVLYGLNNLIRHNMLTKKVFVGCLEQAQQGCKTWLYRVTSFLRDIGFHNLTALEHVDTRPVLALINCALKELYDGKWHEKLVSDHAVRGREEGGNKLRTYRKFKKEYATEQYVSIINQK